MDAKDRLKRKMHLTNHPDYSNAFKGRRVDDCLEAIAVSRWASILINQAFDLEAFS